MKRFELYTHNKQSYDAIKSAFENGQNIASIVQATGTGKTFVAINLAKEVYPKKLLFISPTNAIIEHVQETIKEYGLEKSVNIEFATYQSFINKSITDIQNLEFDYLVVDEFHHSGAPIWGQRITDLINTHKNAFTLGMSAYTIRDKGTAYAMDIAPTIIEQMTDESVDEDEELPIFANSIVYKFDLADALIDGVLKEPKYIASDIKLYAYLKDLEDKVINGNSTAKEKETYLKELDSIKANLILSDETKQILTKNIKPNSKCIYFVPTGKTDGKRNIENAKNELKNIFPNAVIYSTTSDDKDGEKNREAFYNDKDLNGNDVSQNLRIMVAINQYNEGVHAKGVDTVIMGRSTQSDIVFYEQLGRALSVNTSSTPLCIDLSGNIDFILDLSNEIGYRIRERYASNGKNGILDRSMPSFTFGLDIKQIDLLDRLMQMSDKLDNWLLRYNQLIKYLDEHNGEYPSTTNTDHEIKALAQWVNTQRKLYRNDKLSQERIELLNKINFVFDQQEYIWLENYNKLKKYLEEHNGKYPSKNSTDPEIKSLAIWVQNQRKLYRNGKLSQKRIDSLNKINFVFEPLDADAQWLANYTKLKKYLKEHNGEYPSQYSTDTKIKALARWIQKQRFLYGNDKLSKGRIKLLNEINFVFDQLEYIWLENYKNLKKYLKEHNGEYPSKNSTDPEIKSLARWVDRQRRAYNNGELSQDRINLLNKINFVFEPLSADEKWRANYKKFIKYLEEHNGEYPSKNSTDPKIKYLATWVQTQRQFYKNNKLTQDRIDLLNKINFVFEPIDEQWFENYNKFIEYINEHNGKYPSRDSADPEIKSLAIWVQNQRDLYKKDKLSQERINLLNKINFVFNPRQKKDDKNNLSNKVEDSSLKKD